MSDLLPSALHSQKDLLFGNMPEIYQFHSRQSVPTNTHTFTNTHTHRKLFVLVPPPLPLWMLVRIPFWNSLCRVFLQDLQGCLETPEMVGSCFLQRVRIIGSCQCAEMNLLKTLRPFIL